MIFEDDNNFSEDNSIDDDTEISSYFRSNIINLRKNIDFNEFRKFANLDKNSDRVSFILKYEESHELSIQVDNLELKDTNKAKYLKDKGNKEFANEKYDDAIVHYSNAILVAPKEDLGIILGNRSAAFYHLEQFELALIDCDEAIKIGYPKNLLYKIEERKARCLLGLKCHWNAVDSFKNCIKSLDDSKLEFSKKQKIESDSRIMINMMEKSQELNDTKGITKDMILKHENDILKFEKNLIPKLKNSNLIYPSLSNSVKIKDESGDIGRHAISTKDISPGDIIAIENSHCSFLLSEYRLTHCHYCFVRIVSPYPASCYECSSIAYCSPKCRDNDKNIHKIECKLLPILWSSKLSVTCILALRAIIQKPFDQFIKLKDIIKKKSDISEKKPYLGSDYTSFHHLVTHEDERTAEDLFHRAYIASWLLRALKTTNYIPDCIKTLDSAEIPLSDGELFIADALLHNLQLVQFNSHEISEFVRPKSKNDLSKGKSLFVGGGVFPSVALFNHSCNPGVIRYFVGTTMIVRAIKSIPAGAEVSENYGPIFTETPENDRKRTLRLQYWFDCNCEACSEHWPLLHEIDPTTLRFKCETGPTCGNVLPININSQELTIRCSKCGNCTNVFKGLKALQDTESLYKTAVRDTENGKHNDALKSYLKILKILDETLTLPIRDYHLCQQGIRQCMLALGNSSFV